MYELTGGPLDGCVVSVVPRDYCSFKLPCGIRVLYWPLVHRVIEKVFIGIDDDDLNTAINADLVDVFIFETYFNIDKSKTCL
jgi:hypothetical protein